MITKKRFLVVLFALFFALSATIPTAAAEIRTDKAGFTPADVETLSFEKLMNIGVFSKAGESGYQLGRPVTREELAALTVLISGQEYRLDFYKNNSLFPDVPASRWSNAQVAAAASLGYLGALPDGKFHPTDPVSFSSVATIIGKLLGYSMQDLTGDWPVNYLMLLAKKGILDGLSLQKDSFVTRGQVAVMLDRMLDADMRDGTKTFIDTTGAYKNVVVLKNSRTNPEMESDAIMTDKGLFRLSAGLATPDAGHCLAVKFSNTTLKSYSDGSYIYTHEAVKLATPAGVKCQDGKTIVLPFDGVYYLNGSITVRENAIAGLKADSSIVIAQDQAGTTRHVMVFDPVRSAPRVMTSGTINEAGRTFGNELIVRDGKYVRYNQVEVNDLVYRVTDIWGSNGYWIACHDKVSGKLEAILPDKAHPSAVKVDGTVYTLSADFPVEKLAEGNAIKTGDRVTLLFGLEDQASEILQSLSEQNGMYALVLDAFSGTSVNRETFGEKQYFVNLLQSDGNHQIYIVPSDMSQYKNGLVTYQITAQAVDTDDFDRVTLTPVTCQDAGETEVHQPARMLGDSFVADDVVIFNLVFGVYGRESDASVLSWSDLPDGRLPAGKVKYMHRSGDFQDIDVLFVENVLDQNEALGLITHIDAAGDGETGSIDRLTLLVNGQEKTYDTLLNGFAINDVLKVRMSNGQILSVEGRQTAQNSSQNIEAVDGSRIRINGTTYSLSSSLSVYQYGSDGWRAVGTSKLVKGAYKQRVTLYLDKPASYGGKVSVILIN